MTDPQTFWKDFKNHAEMKRLLVKHEVLGSPEKFDVNVRGVARSWMKIAKAHLAEAESCDPRKQRRTFYSRSYYAVYNASKSVRYLVSGWVSDKGDDHQKVSELPTDFPEVERWGNFLRKMYERRLVADYDGWKNSLKSLNPDIKPVLQEAEEFIKTARKYLKEKFGETI